MLYGLQSIHQTDWQGRVELSGQPRTNYNTPSEGVPLFNQWNSLNASATLTGGVSDPTGGTGAVKITGTTQPSGFWTSHSKHGTSGMAYMSCWIRADVDTEVQYGITNNDRITATPTWTKHVVAVPDGENGLIYIRVDNGEIEVFGVSWVTQPGAYIPTTTAPVTVTDYTVDETGSVEVGDAGPSGAELDWTGSAFAGTRIVEANATVFGTKDGSNKNFQLVGEDGYTVTSIHAGWPDSLPCPIATGGASYAPFMDNVVSTQMSTGAPKRRRRFSSVPETFEVKVLLNSEGVSALQTFVKDTLQDVKPFIWKDFRTNQLVSYVFQNRPSYSHASGTKGMWEASLSLRTVT